MGFTICLLYVRDCTQDDVLLVSIPSLLGAQLRGINHVLN